MSAADCASTQKQEGTGEYTDDSVITNQVKARLLSEPNMSSGQINVETFKSIVQLSNFVSSQADIRVVEIAPGVGDVKSVKNDMRLR